MESTYFFPKLLARFLGFCLSPFFDAAQLMRPESFERLRPLVQRSDCFSVRSIQHLPPIPSHPHQSNFSQHPQMLRHRRLSQPKPRHDGAHRPFLASQVIQNLPPRRLSHRIKSIRSSRRPCHAINLYSYIGICQGYHHYPSLPDAPTPSSRERRIPTSQPCHLERSMSDRVRSNVRSRGTPRPFPPPQSSGTFSEKKPRAFPSPAHCRTLRKHLASTARNTCETLTTVYTSERAPIGGARK
jgi:hypothetical protein